MKLILLQFFLSINLFSCRYEIPIVEIDLDGPAETRWNTSLKMILENYGWENSFLPTFRFWNTSLFNHLPQSYYEVIGQSVDKYFPKYAAELRGLTQAFNRTDVTYEYLAAWAYFHELAHTKLNQNFLFTKECTGVLVEIPDGTILHGRNMDQQPKSDRNITLHMKLKKNGIVIGEAVDWYWFNAGFMTALKPGVASLEENWRLGDVDHLELIQRIRTGIKSQVWLFREVLEEQGFENFTDIVNYLNTVETGSPMYNIIAGTKSGEGVIISRDHHDTLPLKYLPKRTNDQQRLFIVQTNDDFWVQDSDSRRTIAEQLLNDTSIDINTTEGLFRVMDTQPVYNEDTLYTAIMIPKLNYLECIGQN